MVNQDRLSTVVGDSGMVSPNRRSSGLHDRL
jgi:hypothetical protein